MGGKTVLGMTATLVMFIIHQEFILLPAPYCSFSQCLGPLEDICSIPAFSEPPSGHEKQTPSILPSCVGCLLWGGGDETQNRLCKEFYWLECKRSPLHSILKFPRSRPWGKMSSASSLFGKWSQEISVGEWRSETGKRKEPNSSEDGWSLLLLGKCCNLV